MHEQDSRQPHPSRSALSTQAFLYARGELSAEESQRFEARLENEVLAQDALCQAVEFSHALAGLAGPRPNPSYRQRVHDQLRPRHGRTWSRPVLWGLGGAIAACLGVVLLWSAPASQPAASFIVEKTVPPTDSSEDLAAVTPAPEVVPEPLSSLGGPSGAEVAQAFARLHNSKHLARAVAEENRRKVRAEGHRLARGEDRPFRRSGFPVMSP